MASSEGIERDRLSVGSGKRLSVGPATVRLRLVTRPR